MNKLLVIGAGNVGAFVGYNILEFGDYEVIGFLDDDPAKLGTLLCGIKVIGPIDQLDSFRDSGVKIVIAISSPQVRTRIAEKVGMAQFDVPNLVSRNVWLSKGVKLGRGIILYPGVSINYETIINDFVIINMNCAIGHNCILESFVSLAPGVNLGGFTHLEEGSSLGIGVATRQKVRVGKGAVIGGQAMVVRDVAAGKTVMGVPAKLKREDE